MKTCVTTVALPDLTLEEQCQLLKGLGYDGIELRVRRVPEHRRNESPSPWGVHVNDLTPENLQDKSGEIRSQLRDHGLQLAGLASSVACTDLEQVKLLLEGSVAVGAPFFRVGAAAGYDGSIPYRAVYGETVAGFARVLDCTRGSGVKVVLEIHGGTIHPSASLAHRVVSLFDPSLVGVIYDPQNMVQDGFETTRLALDLLGPYLAHCHVGGHRPLRPKGDGSWLWEGCDMEEGLYNYPAMLRHLRTIGYAGFVSVEDFRTVPALEKFGKAIRFLRSIE